MRKFVTTLAVLATFGSLALMATEASAQRVARRGVVVGPRGGVAAVGPRGGVAVGPRGGVVVRRGGWRGNPGWGWGAGAAALGLGLGAAAAGAYYGSPYYYGYPPGCVVRQWTAYGWQLVRVC